MAPGRRGTGRGGAGGGGNSNSNMNRKPQANNHSRKARGAAAAAAASSGSGKNKVVKNLANVFSLEDEDESKSARRRKQYLDEVDNYEYNVDEIDDEDDEEIDSDEAFDEDDEEKYENFQFYGSKDQAKKNNKKKQLADKKVYIMRMMWTVCSFHILYLFIFMKSLMY
jgi:U3 small nucleolar RNA-associated protein 14